MAAYERDLVELILPCLWDSKLAADGGLPHPQQAEENMPKAEGNPAEGYSHAAQLADVRKAWRQAPLSIDQRRALFCRFGLMESHRDAGRRLGAHNTSVMRWVDAGVGLIRDWLNNDLETLDEWESV